MPIRPELRWYYPIDWPLLSKRVRFERAKGRCETCGRPHLATIHQLADGRWYDEAEGEWRDDGGRTAAWPNVETYAGYRVWRVLLGTAHLDHDPTNSRFDNLKALCQRCHLRHDRKEHRRRRRLTYLLRRALGDLFHGPYRPF
ncbi:MAG: hypothetical protein KDG89_04985 [Geminicoccaceae bacterium]|nr:hypothetical protein [Geminicoccaceae bacterium]